MSKFLQTFLGLSCVVSMLAPSVSFAQAEPAVSDGEQHASTSLSFARSSKEVLPNTVDCFDYYTFGSVQVDVEPSVEGSVAGAPITFSGKVVNHNPYPIVHGQVMVKIFKTTATVGTSTYQNGYPVVDQYIALPDVTIPANGETPVSFDWNIPTYLLTGDYELDTYFMTGKRFNLLGLPFTDDVTGDKFSFSVQGQVDRGVAFDKNSVTLNGAEYSFASYPPAFSATNTVRVAAKITNDTTETQLVPVSWILYNWAGERVENKLDAKTDTLTLAAGETKTISYDAVESTGAISFVQAIATYKDTKSILNVRFSRDNKFETRLNFPSVLSYPLTAGHESTVFSCLHSTSQPVVDGGKLILTLTDSTGALIHTYTYEGGVSGAMMGVKDTFVPDRTITDFTLTANLYKDNQSVEEIKVVYDCRDIDATLCAAATEPVATTTPTVTSHNAEKIAVGVGLGSLLILGILSMVWFKRRKRQQALEAEEWSARSSLDTMVTLMWAVVLSGSLAIGFVPHTTYAVKSVTYSAGDTVPMLYHRHDSSRFDQDYVDSNGGQWHAGIDPSTANITYRAKLTDVLTGAEIITNPIPVGTRFRVQQVSHVDTDISWWGQGYGYDSPYGRWVKDAALPNVGCSPTIYLWGHGEVHAGNWIGWNNASVYGALSVNPPAPVVVNPSANLECTGNICKVIAPGAVSVGLQFPDTVGRYYFRYFVWEKNRWGDLGLGCYTPSEPMRTYGSNNDFVLPIPAKTITFTMKAKTPSNPPTGLTITPHPTNTNFSGESQGFSIKATDPDGDQIKYGIDWDNAGGIDQWAPGASFVVPPDGVPGFKDSGDAVNPTYTWIGNGPHTFRVIAIDETGAMSKWVSYTITIKKPGPIVTFTTTGCTISLDSANCEGKVSWAFAYAQSPYKVVNSTTNRTIGTVVSDTQLVTLMKGDNKIEGYHNTNILLNSAIISTVCVRGAVWYGGKCIKDTTPTLTLTMDNAVVRIHGSTTATWKISDMTSNTCTLRKPDGSRVPITDPVGSLEVGPFNSAVTLELVCTSPIHAPVRATATVEVVPSVTEI